MEQVLCFRLSSHSSGRKQVMNKLTKEYLTHRGFPVGSVVKNLPANAGDARYTGSIPGLGISPGRVNGNPLPYFCLGNSKDRGACWARGHRVTQTQMSV